MSGNIDSDPAIAYAIPKVYADYGDKVSVSAKRKDLKGGVKTPMSAIAGSNNDASI